MNANAPSPAPPGRVVSLHLHPAVGGAPLSAVDSLELVAGQGIRGNPRYFDRPTRRQVTLIGREQLAAHAAALGVPAIAPGAARANVETEGVDWSALVGQQVAIGEAVLLLYEARLPCAKMDAVCPGLRRLMGDGRQGVLAQVLQSGRIARGDAIRLVKPEAAG